MDGSGIGLTCMLVFVFIYPVVELEFVELVQLVGVPGTPVVEFVVVGTELLEPALAASTIPAISPPSANNPKIAIKAGLQQVFSTT